MPAVTVVVATRDRRPELLRTLRELADIPERPPVIVVDNASSDGTTDAVRAAHPSVQVVRLDRNLGAAARTAGVRLARTRYVAFADDDSWWAPGSLARAADVLDAHPRMGLLAATTLVGEQQEPDPVTAQLAAAPLGTEPDLPGPSVLGFLACAAVVRRDAYLAVGGFEELLLISGEESLLAVDLAAAGWGLAYVADVVAHHHPSVRRSPRRAHRILSRRNELLVAWLRLPARDALRDVAHLLRAACGDAEQREVLRRLLLVLPAATRKRRALPPHVLTAVRRLAETGAAG